MVDAPHDLRLIMNVRHVLYFKENTGYADVYCKEMFITEGVSSGRGWDLFATFFVDRFNAFL